MIGVPTLTERNRLHGGVSWRGNHEAAPLRVSPLVGSIEGGTWAGMAATNERRAEARERTSRCSASVTMVEHAAVSTLKGGKAGLLIRKHDSEGDETRHQGSNSP